MTLAQFQEALAWLIRLPEHNRGEEELPAFLSNYTLDIPERQRLKALASDAKVAKFGRQMRRVRRVDALRELPLASGLLLPTILLPWLDDDFELGAARLDEKSYGAALTEHLANDERARAKLNENGQPFLADLVRFESAEVRFAAGTISTEAVPPTGCLRHRDFLVVELGYDIPALKRQYDETQELASPDKRPLKLLMLAKEEAPFYRAFEVDDSVADFLAAAAKGAINLARPACFAELVSLGLCLEV